MGGVGWHCGMAVERAQSWVHLWCCTAWPETDPCGGQSNAAHGAVRMVGVGDANGVPEMGHFADGRGRWWLSGLWMGLLGLRYKSMWWLLVRCRRREAPLCAGCVPHGGRWHVESHHGGAMHADAGGEEPISATGTVEVLEPIASCA